MRQIGVACFEESNDPSVNNFCLIVNGNKVVRGGNIISGMDVLENEEAYIS